MADSIPRYRTPVPGTQNLSLKSVRLIEDRGRRLWSENRLAPYLIPKIHVAAVQAVALYEAKLWCCRQIGKCKDYQKPFNTQGRAFKGMLWSVPVGVVLLEDSFRPAVSLVNNRKRRYVLRLLAA